jgi:hypothetical protein
MRERRVRHRLDFLHVEDAQVRLPLMELVPPVMVRAEICRRGWPRVARLNMRQSPTPSTAPGCTPKPTIRRVNWSITASTQCAQDGRFAAKQIDAPQTVLRVTLRARLRPRRR